MNKIYKCAIIIAMKWGKIVTVFIANKIFTGNGVLYLLWGNYDY